MNYTLIYATKKPRTLSLDKCGNFYRIVIWNSECHAIEWRTDFDRYDDALSSFNVIVDIYEYDKPVTIEHEEFSNID